MSWSAAEARKLAGRVLWIGFEGPEADADLLDRLSRGEAGAVVLFRRNLVHHAPAGGAGDELDTGALVALNRDLHQAGARSGHPLLVAVDQEGGRVQRVRRPATRWPPMLRFAAVDGAASAAEELAARVGRAMGDELRAVGFDVDFAPVLDVHTNDDNPIIGDRAFGRTPESVARRAGAFAAGLAQAGILACGKHFPGHGDTDVDSHLELPRLPHDMERLRRVELLPFAMTAAKLPMIMTAHVVFEAIDPGVPATMSRKVLGGILRGELGFDGVVVSDDLDMKAIADHMGVADGAVAAVDAGCDALLLCRDRGHQDAAFEALVRRAERDATFHARLAEAAGRVAALTERLETRPAPPSLSILGTAQSLADQLAGA